MLEVVADADERPARLERRLAEHLEQRGALLDELEQAAVGLELLGAHLAEQVGGAADVEPLLRRDELGERRPERGEERALAQAEARVVEAAAQERRAELKPGDRLVQVLARPLARAPSRPAASKWKFRFVTPPADVMTTTITSSGWSSSTSTWTTVVASSGGAETSASRRVTCESISVVAWSADSTSVRVVCRSSGNSAGTRIEAAQQLVGVVAVAALGRHAARGGVRVREQAERLELGELRADRRRTGGDDRPSRRASSSRPAARRDELLDDAAQDLLLTLRQLHL